MDIIQENWKYEFAGFCWGEAYIGVTRYFRRKVWGDDYWLFRGQVKIGLREDDLPLLRYFQSKLGGHIYKAGKRKVKGQNGKEYEQRQNFQWIVTNHDGLRIISKILNQSVIPAKKRKSLEVLDEFLNLAHKMGKRYSKEDWNKMEEIRKRSILATKFE